jgi:hypothetical protein
MTLHIGRNVKPFSVDFSARLSSKEMMTDGKVIFSEVQVGLSKKSDFLYPLGLSLSKGERLILMLSRFDWLSANGIFLFGQPHYTEMIE